MAAENGIFSHKPIGTSKLAKKPCTLLNAARHNLREIQAELGANQGIDTTKSASNQVLAGPRVAAEVVELARNLEQVAGVIHKRSDYCQAIEAVFSLHVDTPVDRGQYFAECIKWARQAYKMPVLSAVIHRDQATPHMHILLLPLVNGKYVGSAPITKPETKRLSSEFFEMVAGPAGLKRSNAKFMGQTKKNAIALVLEVLDEYKGAAWASIWPLLTQAVSKDPTPWVEALGIPLEALRTNPNPKGFTEGNINPIGIEKKARTALPKSNPNLCRVRLTNSRIEQAQEVQSQAIERHKKKLQTLISLPETVRQDDGLFRVRDEDAQFMPDYD